MSEFYTQPDASLRPPLIDVSDEELAAAPEDLAYAILCLNTSGWVLEPSEVEPGRPDESQKSFFSKFCQTLENQHGENWADTLKRQIGTDWPEKLYRNIDLIKQIQSGESDGWKLKLSHYRDDQITSYSQDPSAMIDGILGAAGAIKCKLRDDFAGNYGIKIYKGVFRENEKDEANDVYFIETANPLNIEDPSAGYRVHLLIASEEFARSWLGAVSDKDKDILYAFNQLSDRIPNLDDIALTRHKIFNIVNAAWMAETLGWKITDLHDTADIKSIFNIFSKRYRFDDVFLTAYIDNYGTIFAKAKTIADIANMAAVNDNPNSTESNDPEILRHSVPDNSGLLDSTNAEPIFYHDYDKTPHGYRFFEGNYNGAPVYFSLNPDISESYTDNLHNMNVSRQLFREFVDLARSEQQLLIEEIDRQKGHFALNPEAWRRYYYARSPNWPTLQAYEQHPQEFVDNAPGEVPPFVRDWIDEFMSYLRPEARAIEYGSGSGRDALYMRGQGLDVECSDAPDSMVEILDDKGLDPSKINVVIDELEAGKDAAIMNAVIPHFSPREANFVAYKMNDVLKKGGILAFTVIEGSGDYLDESIGAQRYYNRWTKEEIRMILKLTGFELISEREGKDYDEESSHKWLGYIARKKVSKGMLNVSQF